MVSQPASDYTLVFAIAKDMKSCKVISYVEAGGSVEPHSNRVARRTQRFIPVTCPFILSYM